LKRDTPDEVVERIRAIGDRIRARNEGKPPLLKPGQSYRDLAHSEQPRFFDLDGLLSRIRSHEAAIRCFGISHVDIFGSWAHGSETNDSDLDLVVHYEPGRKVSCFHLARVKTLLEHELGVRVDILLGLTFLSHGKSPETTVRVF
jgi:predicted nucleotidyltransferase